MGRWQFLQAILLFAGAPFYVAMLTLAAISVAMSGGARFLAGVAGELVFTLLLDVRPAQPRVSAWLRPHHVAAVLEELAPDANADDPLSAPRGGEGLQRPSAIAS